MDSKNEWLLKRNCALSPRQFALASGGLSLCLVLVAIPFAVLGAWYVLLFAALEVAGVTAAFLHYARHATDREHILLAGGWLVVEHMQAGRVQEVRLNPHWTRVISPESFADFVLLQCGKERVEVGRYLPPDQRRLLAAELRRELQEEQRESHAVLGR